MSIEAGRIATRQPEAEIEHQPGLVSIAPAELDLTHTLTPGQAFRWSQDPFGRWTGVVRGKVVRIRREDGDIFHKAFPGGPDEALIRDYFRLDVRLADLLEAFQGADSQIANAVERFRGLRVLRQEPVEALLSYVCSAANSVPRITAAVEQMSRLYGNHIATVGGRDYYSFPTPEAIVEAGPDELSSLCGLGFRGANLHCVASQLLERGDGWLESLREADYENAKAELMSLRCVGAKIADCVLLFSLDKDQAVPVDTHVRQVTVERYLPRLSGKTLTPCVCRQITEYFQQKFGQYAGWAQEYLFYDHLLQNEPENGECQCAQQEYV